MPGPVRDEAENRSIVWPDRYHPSRTPVHVRNELAMPDASPQAAWAWLIRAACWPDWYPNSANVRILSGGNGGENLALGARFRWKTFGVTIESQVREFEPCRRIGWDAQALGLDVYHAWLIEPAGKGCWVLTEETQHGFLARLGHAAMPWRMGRYHQIWLERLRDKASAGAPIE